MTIPASFTSALSTRGITGDLWIEIEGIPVAFGLSSAPGSFFGGRVAAEQRTARRGTLVDVPAGVAQEAQPLEGTSTIGSMDVSLLLDADARSLVSGSSRVDGLIPMQAPESWQATHAHMIGDIMRPVRIDAAGSARWFRCTTGGTGGATEPSWAATGTTADGAAVWTVMGPRDLSVSGTDLIPFTGSASSFAASGVLYLGRETIAYTSIVSAPNGGGYFSGVSRGQYALPGRTASQEHTESDLISPYPRFLQTRAVVVLLSLDGTDAGKVTRWAGTVAGAKMGNGATLDLSLESASGELRATIMGTQRTGKLAAGLADGAGAYSPAAAGEVANEMTRLLLSSDSMAGEWTAGETMLVRVGDEWITGTVVVSGGATSITITSRAVLSSKAAQHPLGSDVKECMFTGAYSASGTPEARISKFTKGDHPLEVLLQWILSRRGDGANGPYDVLPIGWGAGIDQSRVDVAGMLALKRAWFPSARHVYAYDAPFSLEDAAREVLRPHGCYYVGLLNDLLSVRRLSVPIAGATLRAITADDIVARPTWSARLSQVVGRVIVRADYDPIADDYRQTYRGEMQGQGVEAQEFNPGKWSTVTVEARGQFTGLDPGAAYFGSAIETDAAATAQRLFEMIRDRYAHPLPLIGCQCSYKALDIQIGDLVALTIDVLPDVSTGGTGLNGVICEVVGTHPDERTATVELALAQLGLLALYRLVAPTGVVSSWLAGTKTATLLDGEFNDAGQDRTNGFAVGQKVRIYSADLSALRGTVTVAGVTSTTLVFDAAPAGVVATDIVILSSYDDQPAIEKLSHAYLADAASSLGIGNDPAHRLAT